MRACLNADNLIGLVYLHDPDTDPRTHVAAAADVRRHLSCGGLGPSTGTAGGGGVYGGGGGGGSGSGVEVCQTPPLTMVVFQMDGPASRTGHFLVVAEGGSGGAPRIRPDSPSADSDLKDSAATHGCSSQGQHTAACRLLTFEEFVRSYQQQQRSADAGRECD